MTGGGFQEASKVVREPEPCCIELGSDEQNVLHVVFCNLSAFRHIWTAVTTTVKISDICHVASSLAVLGRALLSLFCFCVFSERGGRFPVEPWTRLHCSRKTLHR